MEISTTCPHRPHYFRFTIETKLAAVVVVVTLTLTLVMMAAGGLERTCTMRELLSGSPRGVCGPRLSRLICSLCHRYNKRSVDGVTRRSTIIAALLVQQLIAASNVTVWNASIPDHSLLEGDAAVRPGHVVASKMATSTDLPFLSTQEALSFSRGRSRRSQSGGSGIVCECCINKCDLNELLEYCQPREPDDADDGETASAIRLQRSRNSNC